MNLLRIGLLSIMLIGGFCGSIPIDVKASEDIPQEHIVAPLSKSEELSDLCLEGQECEARLSSRLTNRESWSLVGVASFALFLGGVVYWHREVGKSIPDQRH